MSDKTIIAIAQLQRELERAQRLNANDPHIDWQAYSSLKSALLAVAPLLLPELALLATNLVGTIDGAYTSVLTKEE